MVTRAGSSRAGVLERRDRGRDLHRQLRTRREIKRHARRADTAPDMIGVTLGSYEVTEKIGSGGVGDVYKAVDHLLGRNVALKFLRPSLADCAEVVQRFHAEARTLAQLIHPNIAVLYCMMREGAQLAMVMEYVEGRTFGQLLDSGPLPVARAIPLLMQALEGIGHAHAAGVIHRDIKPSNLMVAANGCVKVMDFGVARCLGTVRQTRDGHMIGTAQYMSPEQVRGLESDARSDVYALGVLAYEMVTGFVPFDSDSEYELCRAQVEDAPRAPRTLAPDLSPELEAVILRALEKDPSARFNSVQALREALQAVVSSTASAAEPPDADSLATRLVTTPLRVALPSLPSVLPQSLAVAARATRSIGSRVGFALPLGVLALCALLLGAKLVQQQPAAEELAVTAAAATRTAAPPPPEQLRIALPEPSPAPAPAASPKRPARKLASPRKPELRSAQATAAPQASAEAESGGGEWVVRKR
jgi:eukaryotic-like serine/threonine-protein kinase